MAPVKRVFLVVLDSFGIGEAPDAAAFGDTGSHTLRSLLQCDQPPHIPHLLQLGLGDLPGVVGLLPSGGTPTAAHGRCAEASAGKDTTVGHWEIAGVISPTPLPTFPDGFPAALIRQIEEKTGRGVLCNRPYSGTAVIQDYGEEHGKTGKLIVYTSADSVLQIAAHEEVVPVEELYAICRTVRELACGPFAVGRIIARPFRGEPGKYQRTARRHDFSLPPPAPTLLDAVKDAGQDCIAVGKIQDIFAGRGVTEHIPTAGNAEGIAALCHLPSRPFCGLAFVNLVDFDTLYGHRRDCVGYARALSVLDDALPLVCQQMGEDDLLCITADHGCDPGFTRTTDHTREYTPLLIYGPRVRPVPLGTRTTFADIGATVAEALGLSFRGAGHSFWKEIQL